MWGLLLCVTYVSAQTANLSQDLVVTGTLNCAGLNTVSVNASNNLQVTESISTQSLTTTSLEAGQVTASTLASSVDVLRIQGDVVISRTSVSYLQLQSWREVSEDDFEEDSSGWTEVGLSTCAAGNRFLGGHCKLSNSPVSKVYTLPPHTAIRVTASYHMLDNWQGETAFLKADNVYVWTLSGGFSSPEGLNVCGGPEADPRLAAPVDVTFKHNTKRLQLTFGSTITGDPCAASYGIDEVVVYIQ